ncbi:MAG: phospho-N-acetylmuramoyl-pentapeptide-transferase [Firmicutes bacterium]|jgi:phospho-N-acetylmuramoyl-pentapeptide-transferase|nr:phospho-N-acetylmuramoyl-pentapeptide-transferase [Bacillota bacterium]
MLPVYFVAIIAFFLSIIICPVYIGFSRRQQYGQQVRSDGPRRHYRKAGTPTMGGIVFLLSFLIVTVIFAPKTPLLFLALFITLGNAFLGFIDDYQKVVRRRSLGLRAREKLLGQFIFALLFYFVLALSGHSTVVNIPFFALQLDFGLFYPFLIFILMIGFSNAVNLTDGIDGLAGGTAIVALLAFLFIASVQGIQEIVYFCGTLVGACFGFLVFNLHPARVFMGDVGSLSLGTALAVVAVLTKAEFSLIIIGGVFVLETLSVIVQVISFKLTGKRVFLMSPLHHHFEMKGWSEWHVVTGFWALGFCFAILGLLEYTPILGW